MDSFQRLTRNFGNEDIHILGELVQFFGSPQNMQIFLEYFQGDSGRRLAKIFRETFSSKEQAQRRIAESFLALLGTPTRGIILASLLSGDRLLDAVLPTCTTDRLSSKSSISSQTNNDYIFDPIALTHFVWNQSNDHLATVWLSFHRKIRSINGLFYDGTYRKIINLEGDVADICLINILLPVVLVMNAYLAQQSHSSEPEYEVSIVAQYRNNLLATTKYHYVDHCLVLHHRKKTRPDYPLVLFEEKIIGAVRMTEWLQFSGQHGFEAVPSSYTEMHKIVPQIRKYVFETQTPYVMTSDANTTLGMIWGSPSNWNRHRYAESYPVSTHEKRRRHNCYFIPSMNNAHTNYPGPRRVLAFLCFLALRDKGLWSVE